MHDLNYPHKSPVFPHCSGQGTKAQRGKVTCSSSHSKQEANPVSVSLEPGLHPQGTDSSGAQRPPCVEMTLQITKPQAGAMGHGAPEEELASLAMWGHETSRGCIPL